MEIGGLVNYEFLFPLELRHPDTDEKLGITMQIRSAGSDEAKRVLRQHTDKHLERRIKNKMPKSQHLEQEELEKAASYIASWDWGADPKTKEPNTYGGKVPEFSMKTAMEIMEKEGWIFAQVVEAATKIGNFSQRSEKNSPKPSA